METKKYNPFVIKSPTKAKTKPAGSARERSSKPKNKLEAKGWGTKAGAPLSLESKRKLDIIHAKILLRLVGNNLTMTLTITITTGLHQPSYCHHYSH